MPAVDEAPGSCPTRGGWETTLPVNIDASVGHHSTGPAVSARATTTTAAATAYSSGTVAAAKVYRPTIGNAHARLAIEQLTIERHDNDLAAASLSQVPGT